MLYEVYSDLLYQLECRFSLGVTLAKDLSIGVPGWIPFLRLF